MVDWHQLVRLSDRELATVPIVVLNLACAVGLPGSERIDFRRCCRVIDDWAARCRAFTDRVLPMFRAGQCDYPDSEPRFRIQAMVTHLQRDIGVLYRQDRRSDDAVFEPEDSFLNGIIDGKGGTYGSLPVLYAAVGRRMGYPIMLAETLNHCYARWDALPRGDCFNIEASGDGVSFFPDEYYRTGDYEMPPETVRACGYLESMSPREELASFLTQRAECWMQEKVYGEAVTAFAWANELAPNRKHYSFLTWQAMREWDKQLRERVPMGFPMLDIGLPASQFRKIPREWERGIIRMRVMEGVLNHPGYERQWWEPLRRLPTEKPAGLPAVLKIDYRWNQQARNPSGQPM